MLIMQVFSYMDTNTNIVAIIFIIMAIIFIILIIMPIILISYVSSLL